jgi:hypothetical protein
MPTTKSFVYAAGERGFERHVQLSSLAISPSVEDVSFVGSKFKETHWRLYTAATLRKLVGKA